MTTLTLEQLEMGIIELNRKITRLEELQLQESILQTYICDKNGFDMYKLLEGILTSDKNVEMLKQTLTDPEDLSVLSRLVDKWSPAKAARKAYKH